ncbi:/ hsdM / Type I restriction enzyme M protein /:648478 Forward [Candidatus Hepatoplasma crinochetorum]|uniref:site-specific DNA-methyltransferase (adenine-specific) n=1 Tax=Candidatus Hepatoplasma crinochetorum TaxID=295596 RepID=A0A0G7ZMM3_9MOLU|nr:/ hsdM / Type I restriction enzyme M protein /:648478 Forward [Candidatus Hepatoplasma crinochetorum]
MKKEELNAKLWNIANKLRGRMDANEFKKYILGFIFFKYISTNLENYYREEEFSLADLDQEVKEDVIDQLGYFINPNHFYSKIIENIKNKKNIDNLNILLSDTFKEIENSTSEKSRDDFSGLFDELDLNDKKLGDTQLEINQLIAKIMLELEYFEISRENNDFLGDSYEYLISKFASDAGKKGGEFYTPIEVGKTIAKIVATSKKAKEANVIYDPTCGSGSLLIRAYNEIKNIVKNESNNLKKEIPTIIQGQELNHTTYNLARMNMILHGFNYGKFKIKQGDTLKNDKFKQNKKFDIIVANPPFGTKWDPKEKDYQIDDRFAIFDALAPTSRAEFAFIQHMLYHLSEDGIMATVLPHGILFRGGAEEKIRRQIIENYNWFDAIISLPSNLFFGAGIPAIIAVFKKCRENNKSILFIDASKEFEKVKNKNKLRDQDILKIVDTYKNKKEIEKYSRNVNINEIKKNDFNLNISRYIDNFEEETYRPIEEIKRDIFEAEQKEIELKKELQELEKRILEEILQ